MQCRLFLLALLIPFLPLAMINAETDACQKVIVLFGPPASGKGTQAIRLAENLRLPHISTGDLFRENIRNNTPLGRKAKSFIDAGKLVPDELVFEILFDRLSQGDAHAGYILDGFPRTLDQARTLEKKLPPNASVLVLNLVVSDETILKRALGRKRSDDTPEVVKERLHAYYTQTAPLIGYYKEKGILTPIDGEKTPDEVFADLVQALKK
jgi:adenylate kinase